MNIKRRVYDALNVLIAIGLLKKNGHKIMGKRGEESLSVKKNYPQDAAREEVAFEERDALRRELSQKEEMIAQKRLILEGMQQKVAAMRELQTRNKVQPVFKNTLRMPFVVVTGKEG